MIQILGLLGMYFDAVVVEFKTFFIFIQIGLCFQKIIVFDYIRRLALFSLSNYCR